MNGRCNDKRKWQSLRKFTENAGLKPEARNEFPPYAMDPPDVPPDGISRRRFMGLLAASASLAGALGCSRTREEEHLAPYVQAPPGVIPGVPNYYASVFQEGASTESVLVKTREGLPVFLEGNDLASGKISIRTQAQTLALYDPDRLSGPRMDGTACTWEAALERIVKTLRDARAGDREILLLTGAVASPTQDALIERLRQALPTLRHMAWEPAADHASRQGMLSCFGRVQRMTPRFDRARAIVSFECDFLGQGIEAVRAAQRFAEGRTVRSRDDSMSRLTVIEGRMSLTGANADRRIPVRPSLAGPLAFALARSIHEEHGIPLPEGIGAALLAPFDLAELARKQELDEPELRALAFDLAHHVGSSLVLAGPQLSPEAHVACHLLNAMLEAPGSTLEFTDILRASGPAAPDEMTTLMGEMAAGKMAAAILWDVNPSYALPDTAAWKAALQKVPLRVALTVAEDETSAECQVVLPIHHWLESWGDADLSGDGIGLRQPALRPLHDTRQAEDLLLALSADLSGVPATAYLDFLKRNWRSVAYPSGSPVSFEIFWNAALHNGVVPRRDTSQPATANLGPAVGEAAASLSTSPDEEGLELLLHTDMRVYDGRYANSGWLQELPEPVCKTVWGNAVAVSVADAERRGLRDGDVVEVGAGGGKVQLPVLVQPGQAPGVISIALGYGREAGSVAAGIGANAFPLVGGGSSPYLRAKATMLKAGTSAEITRTQEYGDMIGRDLAREQSLSDYAHPHEDHGSHLDASLYAPQEFPDHKWGMVIDLNACIGCSGCAVACQSENNVPVVGPEQVRKGREMHWIRLDRYYEGDPANPSVVHQPILCQHCDNAPCENVCPVNATTHSDEGLNQMAYNRCVGTRYCANNCPYKVRRFNFFDFREGERKPQELVHNPEVSLRPRGVMEKCTFCIQRIENGKQAAKAEGRKPRDGEIRTACQNACPTEAIVFGDLKDPGSGVSKLWKNDRGYRVLQHELGVSPAITYLAKLRNKGEDGGGDSHG